MTNIHEAITNGLADEITAFIFKQDPYYLDITPPDDPGDPEDGWDLRVWRDEVDAGRTLVCSIRCGHASITVSREEGSDRHFDYCDPDAIDEVNEVARLALEMDREQSFSP